ncbi:hypothetical protein H0H93_009387 [Arthromyces matolae]|nr:hypothetical protein H0H93_009387 [Arthromyces matolae]
MGPVNAIRKSFNGGKPSPAADIPDSVSPSAPSASSGPGAATKAFTQVRDAIPGKEIEGVVSHLPGGGLATSGFKATKAVGGLGWTAGAAGVGAVAGRKSKKLSKAGTSETDADGAESTSKNHDATQTTPNGADASVDGYTVHSTAAGQPPTMAHSGQAPQIINLYVGGTAPGHAEPSQLGTVHHHHHIHIHNHGTNKEEIAPDSKNLARNNNVHPIAMNDGNMHSYDKDLNHDNLLRGPAGVHCQGCTCGDRWIGTGIDGVHDGEKSLAGNSGVPMGSWTESRKNNELGEVGEMEEVEDTVEGDGTGGSRGLLNGMKDKIMGSNKGKTRTSDSHMHSGVGIGESPNSVPGMDFNHDGTFKAPVSAL